MCPHVDERPTLARGRRRPFVAALLIGMLGFGNASKRQIQLDEFVALVASYRQRTASLLRRLEAPDKVEAMVLHMLADELPALNLALTARCEALNFDPPHGAEHTGWVHMRWTDASINPQYHGFNADFKRHGLLRLDVVGRRSEDDLDATAYRDMLAATVAPSETANMAERAAVWRRHERRARVAAFGAAGRTAAAAELGPFVEADAPAYMHVVGQLMPIIEDISSEQSVRVLRSSARRRWSRAVVHTVRDGECASLVSVGDGSKALPRNRGLTAHL